MSRYSVVVPDTDPTHVLVTKAPDEVEWPFELLEGMSKLADWPEDVVFDFSPSHPEGIILPDFVDNAESWLVVSERFRRLLIEFDPSHVEYLPVRFRNHKGRPTGDGYWIVNFTTLVEAVDHDRSEYKEDPVDPKEIFSFDKLALREAAAEDAGPIFRLREERTLVLVREDLAAHIKNAGLTGLRLVPSDHFKSLDPDG